MTDRKIIRFVGSARDDLKLFPMSARRDAGFQIDKVQSGLDPDDWKPMTSIGPGVREIRVREMDGAFRVIYLAKFEEAIFILHCFRKKTERTSSKDLARASARYKDVLKERKP